MTHYPPLSLKDNFSHMMARLDAGSLSEEDAREFNRVISEKIDAADRLARDTPTGNTHLFLNARMVLGFANGDARPVLAFPKPSHRPPSVLELVKPI